MKTYYIYHWYRGNSYKPHPSAVLRDFCGEMIWMIDVEDIHQFVEDYKLPIMLVPPKDNFPFWSIYVSDSHKFGQK